MREISNVLLLSTFRVTNIALGLGDKKFFETLQFLDRLRTQTFKEYLRLFFPFSQYGVDVAKVSNIRRTSKVGLSALFNQL